MRQRRSHFSLLNVEEAHRAHEFRRHRVQLGRALAIYRMGRVQGSAVRRNLFLQNHPAHHQYHPAKAKRKRLQRDKKNKCFIAFEVLWLKDDVHTLCTFNMHEINSAKQYTRERLIIYASDGHSSPFNFHFISPLTHVLLEIDDDARFLSDKVQIYPGRAKKKRIWRMEEACLKNVSHRFLDCLRILFVILKNMLIQRLEYKCSLIHCNVVVSGNHRFHTQIAIILTKLHLFLKKLRSIKGLGTQSFSLLGASLCKSFAKWLPGPVVRDKSQPTDH